MRSLSSITKTELESNILNVYKPISQSPVQTINRLKKQLPELTDEKVSPTGRLDPLAHGVMVLLIGDMNKQRRKFEGVDKVYRFDAILGVGTDSYDVLGMPTVTAQTEISEVNIKKEVKKLKGKQVQEFPPYSGYRIKGKPLFYYARNNLLDTIEMPSKEIEVFDIKVLEIKKIPFKNLLKKITMQIEDLDGNFRQEEILDKWGQIGDQDLTVVSIEAHVSAGTYIRGLVNQLGQDLNSNATAMDIYRTKAGGYDIDESIKL